MSAEKTVTVPSVAAMRWINGIRSRAESAIVAVLDFIAHLTAEVAAFILSIAEMALALWIGFVLMMLCVEGFGR